MKHLEYLFLLLFFALVACSSETTSENGGNADSTSTANVTTEGLQKGTFTAELAKGLDYVGEIVYGETWQDKNGENLLIFSEKLTSKEIEGMSETNKELHVYHYANNGSGFKLIREVKDFQEKCLMDNRARFVENSLNITDLDNDNLAEMTFTYRLGCTSELSPDDLKLIMLENGEKYAIRGNTKVDYGGGQIVGGETNIDDQFKKAPTEFLDFAKKIWEQQQVHDSNL